MANQGENRNSGSGTQSTIARSFSASLNDAFAIDDRLDGLAQSVEQKKQAVSSQNAELEALEAKLRETEERLKEKSRNSSPAGRAAGIASAPHARQPLGNTFNGQGDDRLPPRSAGCPLGMLARPPAPASASGQVSASTMSHWRPVPQETTSGAQENVRDHAAERLNGQQAQQARPFSQ